MSQVDKQALREAAQNATDGPWEEDESGNVLIVRDGMATSLLTSVVGYDTSGLEDIRNAVFIAAANPSTMLALLDENESLEKRVADLATENAALKNYQPSPTSAAVFEAIEITERLFDEGRPELAMIRAFNIMRMKRSPSTDAFTNEMRAQGVEMFADLLSGMNISVSETSVREFAKQLRDGKA